MKNKGIQPILDSILKYLPAPDTKIATGININTGEKLVRNPERKDKLCALAFKVVNDKEKGLVTFFRVYSGTLKNRHKLLNSTLNEKERVSGLMRMKADEA